MDLVVGIWYPSDIVCYFTKIQSCISLVFLRYCIFDHVSTLTVLSRIIVCKLMEDLKVPSGPTLLSFFQIYSPKFSEDQSAAQFSTGVGKNLPQLLKEGSLIYDRGFLSTALLHLLLPCQHGREEDPFESIHER